MQINNKYPDLTKEMKLTFAKAEHLNPGGSVKDRVALEMVLDAEARGVLKPGSTLVEATAGNTGIGLAWIAAARGYRFVAVMTEADRGPKTETMEAMGTDELADRQGRRIGVLALHDSGVRATRESRVRPACGASRRPR